MIGWNGIFACTTGVGAGWVRVTAGLGWGAGIADAAGAGAATFITGCAAAGAIMGLGTESTAGDADGICGAAGAWDEVNTGSGAGFGMGIGPGTAFIAGVAAGVGLIAGSGVWSDGFAVMGFIIPFFRRSILGGSTVLCSVFSSAIITPPCKG